MRRGSVLVAALALSVLGAACNTAGSPGTDTPSGLSGTIKIDGSSTVFPISEAIAEEFQGSNSDVRVTVGQSGTGGGFEKFCNGETDISDASRPIKDEEAAKCSAKQIEYAELKVAIDGLSIVVNKDNDFVECLTVADLKKIWEPDSTVKTWKDVKAEWPAESMKLYGPGADSGTFDYFTDEINGEEGASRKDYTASEDDNVLVQGVGGDKNALGYFGYAYYAENTDKLKAVSVDGGQGCVAPTQENIESAKYAPLSRPLYVYAANTALARPEVEAFVEFFLDTVDSIVADVGYVKLPAADLQASKAALTEALGG